ncbi:MAG: damage-inducible protein CinA [Betaproteobacteria bacterium HGW-Betaproteobacteria-22]|nr:MAG: damage-inducible protein CinA [Betaproteobacteria bacterium HGW-Betaproteobacteria-22]
MAQHTNIETQALAKQLGQVLRTRSLVLTIAESCTGGLVSEIITSIAGSSAWFDRGFVTYSNQAKIEMLDVSEETLKKHGAVSEQTAYEMTIGALNHSHAQVGCSVTGIAGPDGGTRDKPVGTVCFAWAINNDMTHGATYTSTQLFTGSRIEIRQQSAIYMMTELIKAINNTTVQARH